MQRKTFVSHRDPGTVADECLRMLRGFRVIVDADEHDTGASLKCRVESFRGKRCGGTPHEGTMIPTASPSGIDPASGLNYEKQLRFRVDIRSFKPEETAEPELLSSLIAFTQERGSATVFNVVIERFHSEWL
jgi:hypothetical protein